jgi:hypothetical protein
MLHVIGEGHCVLDPERFRHHLELISSSPMAAMYCA